MRYIKKVILENFQSHKYSIIELNEELNVIVGPSDTGKSAIIRGIKWVLYNEPAGDYFIREGEREASVTIEFSDNIKIKRYRSKSKNSYYLYKRDGEELIYEGFGTNVPREIIDEIGIEKIHLDSDESTSINLGEQLDGAFLLSEKSGVRASAIGRLVGVNVIDDALRESLRDNRNISTTRKNLDDLITKLEEELKQYDYLSEVNNRINKIDSIKEVIKTKTEKNNTLALLNNNLIKTKSSYKEVYFFLDKLREIENIDSKTNKIEELYVKYKYFLNKNDIYLKVKSGIADDNYIIDKLKDMDLTLSKFDLLSNKLRELSSLQKLQNNISKHKSDLINCRSVINKVKNVPIVHNNSVILQNKLLLLKTFNYINENMIRNKNNRLKGKLYIEKFNGLYSIESNLEKLVLKQNRLNNLLVIQGKFNKNSKDINKIETNIKQNNKDMEEQLLTYERLLSKQEVCPFCLSNIDDDKIKHIMEHYK